MTDPRQHSRDQGAYWICVGAAAGWMFVTGLVHAVNINDSDLVYVNALGVAIACALGLMLRHARQQRRLAQAAIVGRRLQGGPVAETQTQAMTQRRTLWDAIHEALMPHSYHPVDVNETRTFLRLDIRVQLHFADRLRLLLCGQMRVLSTVYTDVEVKECSALTNIEVHPFTIKE